MAGKKGRSGGCRPGAGRKPQSAPLLNTSIETYTTVEAHRAVIKMAMLESLYAAAMRGNATAQIAFLSAGRREKNRRNR